MIVWKSLTVIPQTKSLCLPAFEISNQMDNELGIINQAIKKSTLRHKQCHSRESRIQRGCRRMDSGSGAGMTYHI